VPPFFRAHRATIANLDKVATISPLFKGALLLKMKDAQGSEIQVSERQAKHVRELLQL
jgi:DNA-binding LytR/AlgR family response regulator